MKGVKEMEAGDLAHIIRDILEHHDERTEVVVKLEGDYYHIKNICFSLWNSDVGELEQIIVEIE